MGDDSLIDEMRAAMRRDRERALQPREQPSGDPAAQIPADGEGKRRFRLRVGLMRRRSSERSN